MNDFIPASHKPKANLPATEELQQKQVAAMEKIAKTIASDRVDVPRLETALQAFLTGLRAIPKGQSASDNQLSISAKGLSDLKKKFDAAIDAIKQLDVKVDVEAPDLKPFQALLLQAVEAMKSQTLPDIPATDLSGLEAKVGESNAQLKTANKHLKKLVDKPVGGGSGSGGGAAFVNAAGAMVYPALTAGGAVPVDIQDASITISDPIAITNAALDDLANGSVELTAFQGGPWNVDVGEVATSPVQPSIATLSNVTMTGSSVTLAAQNLTRRNLLIYNDTGVVCYVKLGSGASATSFTVKLADQGYYELAAPAYTGIVTALAASGTVRVTETTP